MKLLNSRFLIGLLAVLTTRLKTAHLRQEQPTTGDIRGYTLGVATAAEQPEIVPEIMALGQNQPNPFNTRTTVSYTLKRPTEVRIDVYNMLGQKVLNVEQGVRAAGNHQATIEAAGMPAGVYVYRLRAGAQDQTRTMTIVK